MDRNVSLVYDSFSVGWTVLFDRLYCLLCCYATQLDLLYKYPLLTSVPFVSPISPPWMCSIFVVLIIVLYCFTRVWHFWHFCLVGTSKKQVERLWFWFVVKVLVLFINVIVVVIIIVTWKHFSTALGQCAHFVWFCFFPPACLFV